MRRIISFLICVVFLFSCGGKKSGRNYLEKKGFAAGTNYIIEYDDNAGSLHQEIDKLLADVNNTVAYSNPNSILNNINKGDSIIKESKHLTSLFNFSSRINKETNGCFDPTIYPIEKWWGREVKKFIFPELIDSSTVDSLQSLSGFSDVGLSNGIIVKKRSVIQLNFSGMYEGYMADQLAQLLDEFNVGNYRVEVNGKLRAKGNDKNGKPWEIGLDEPSEDPKSRVLLATTPFANGGFAIAGSYRDFYTKGEMKMSYTIDPTNCLPVKHTLISAVVFASSAAEAQAYANSFMVMGPERTKSFIKNRQDIQVYLISTNYKGEWVTYISDGLIERLKFVKEEVKVN